MSRRAFLLLLFASPCLCQQITAVQGVVRDDKGRPITGARVEITNRLTGSEIDLYTKADGAYRSPELDAAAGYSVEASQPSYLSSQPHDLLLTSAKVTPVDFVLTPRAGLTMPATGTFASTVLTALLSALISGLVLIIFTEPGRKLLQKAVGVFLWLWNKGYEILAPHFPHMVGLRGYRRRVQRSELSRLEHPVGPGDSDGFSLRLDRAFAPLAVMSGDGSDRVDVFSFAMSHKHFIVLGGPGTGKTTLMKSLVMSSLAGRTNTDLDEAIPVFVVLRELSAANHTVKEALVAALGRFRFRNSEKFISSLLERGKLLIVLDGLDEVGNNRDFVIRQIRTFCQLDEQQGSPNRLIVTCRENSYKVRDLADVIASVTRVEPFSPQHMRRFLQGWPSFKGRHPLQLYSQIQSDSQIFDICRNPLLLTLLAGLYLSKERFDLPSSRKAFYDTAIDELLVQRPARKLQSQIYGAEHKMPILQRIALDRLETLGKDDDPELLSRERLLHFAKQVVGQELKETDFQTLLLELDTINSIIKPVFDGGYVFGHRTFQEYLAAREANRTRTEDQVVAVFGTRSELTEVLCFYCGLVKTIPTIDKILSTVLVQDVILAGRCVQNVIETPSQEVVLNISRRLSQRIKSNADYHVELELLSSMAQRSAAEFDSTREIFAEVVEELVRSSETGSAGFLSALAGNPTLSMSLIPGLLHHESEKWRLQAVELLYNLGTEDALQQLAQIVVSGESPQKEWAAVWIANQIRTHTEQLKSLVDLFPEKEITRVQWPFAVTFPSRIGYALVEAIAHGSDSAAAGGLRNECILEALVQFRRPKGGWKTHQWQTAEAYATANRSLVRGIRHSIKASPFAFVALMTVIVVALSISCFTRKAFLLDFWPTQIRVAPISVLQDLADAAAQVNIDIERGYPPQKKGFWRVLPWNWFSSPSVPKGDTDVVSTLEGIRCDFACRDPSSVSWKSLFGGLDKLKVASVLVDHMRTSVTAANALQTRSKAGHILIAGNRKGVAVFGLLCIATGAMLLYSRRRRKSSSALHSARTMTTTIVFVQVMIFVSSGAGGSIFWVFLAALGMFVLQLAEVMTASDTAQLIPNPYVPLLEELRPLSPESEEESGSKSSAEQHRLGFRSS